MADYIIREAQQTLEELLGQFKVVLVTGARQVGKTTMIKEMLSDDYEYVTLDSPRIRNSALDDPELFMNDHQPPVIIDEIQRAPILFDQIKAIVDAFDRRGSIVLTGSQTLHLMDGISESLAGRVGIMHLPALSLRELTGSGKRGIYIPSEDAFSNANLPDNFDIWEYIWKGGYPELYSHDIDWERYFEAYLQTYVERDVRSLVNVQDEEAFSRFVTVCASRTGQLLNFSEIGSEVGVTQKTAQRWISVLRASGLVFVLRPFASNIKKRLTKMPKLYFMDTGLASFLLGWTSPRVLRDGAMAGHIFETYVVSEIVKTYMNDARSTDVLSFYRDNKGNEIDLVIKRQDTLHPVEIKKTASPTRETIKSFHYLDEIPGAKRGEGAVICLSSEVYSLSGTDKAVPVHLI